jgi:F-type H+-transporting ATPase subunit b
MEINPILIGLQVIPFLVVLVGLHFIIFKPMLRLLAEREKAIVQDRKDAEELEGQVQEKMTELEERLAQAKAAANADRRERREEIRQREEEILTEARNKAEVMVDKARAEIEAEAEAARRTLREESEGLAKDVASSVLGRAV